MVPASGDHCLPLYMEVVTLVLTSASCDRKLLGNGLCPPRSEKEEEDLQVLEQTFSLSPW